MRRLLLTLGVVSFAGIVTALRADPSPPRKLDQGAAWTDETRAAFYTLDQGSQLIPLAWLKALRRPDGSPMAEHWVERYGFLKPLNAAANSGLPLGITVAPTATGPVVGMTCAACHTREITEGNATYRIDGGPAFIDFSTLMTDLDDAVAAVLKDDSSFAAFAKRVTADHSQDAASLRKEVTAWATRFHALICGSIDRSRRWGPGRLDAMQLIFNQLAGTDIGPGPDHIIAGNIKPATAPVRYPFVWNAALQDHVQWGGFSKNGNDIFALTRNLGQLYGVFGAFTPLPHKGQVSDSRDYLSANSANVPNLLAAEALIRKIGAPAWPFPVDKALADKGAAIFARSTAEGGCVECHGQRPGAPRPPATTTWDTPRLDVGTDSSVWDRVLLRPVDTGTLEGAGVPGYFPPLKKIDSALSTLEVAVLGSIFQYQAAHASGTPTSSAAQGMDMKDRASAMPGPPNDMFKTHVFEARVLRGIWAAAPYLHNGSVPTLADLLTPPAERPMRFTIGPSYDRTSVGLARDQGGGRFTFQATGCADTRSGNSNCGHDYGTRLPAVEKKALLEYLKTL